ncbi:MAG: hypothetical protein ACOCZ5_02800 [bacterium]
MEFKLNNKKYELSVAWQTTTLKQGIDIMALDFPEKKLESLLEDDGSIIYDKDTIDYMRKVISILSFCPYQELQHVDDKQIESLWCLVSYIVKSLYLLDFSNYKPKGITEINFLNKKYKLPKSLFIDDQEILAYKEPSINIVEVSNLAMYLSEMKSKGLNSMKYICAILLKEDEGELYDEEKIAEKAKLFEQLPLSIAFECFFFINYFSINYLSSSINYLPQKEKVGVVKKISNTILGYIQSLKQVWSAILMKLRK